MCLDPGNIMLRARSQTQKGLGDSVMQVQTGRPVETESRLVAARAGGWEGDEE